MKNDYLKSIFVLLAAFLATVAVLIPLYFMLTGIPGFEGADNAIVTAVVVLYLTLCLRGLAGRFLFDKDDTANVQVLGGVRLGGRVAAALSGRSVSWPFAKLSASPERLRLQTPFGKYAWNRQDVHLTSGALGQWKIETNIASMEITFYALPWVARGATLKLRRLGYFP